MQQRLDRDPNLMRIQRQTVKHSFGTLKHWMGSTHFLMRTLANVRTEMGLHVWTYNMKRVMRIIGIESLHAGNGYLILFVPVTPHLRSGRRHVRA